MSVPHVMTPNQLMRLKDFAAVRVFKDDRFVMSDCFLSEEEAYRFVSDMNSYHDGDYQVVRVDHSAEDYGEVASDLESLRLDLEVVRAELEKANDQLEDANAHNVFLKGDLDNNTRDCIRLRSTLKAVADTLSCIADCATEAHKDESHYGMTKAQQRARTIDYERFTVAITALTVIESLEPGTVTGWPEFPDYSD